MNIRCNARIPGFYLTGVPFVVSPLHQYADDTTLILSRNDSIKAVFNIYSLFKKASGSRLNQSKSKRLWLGSWVGRLDPPVALGWSPSKLKILGIYVGLGNLEEDNWGPRFCAVEKKLCFLGVSVIFHSGARLWSLTPMPCHAFGMLHPLFTCLRGF